jgi:type II secretory pathway pseudopilin PulG
MKSRFSDESGVTMLELMVVVLTIGALIAIGAPTMTAVRQLAHDRVAQSTLRNAYGTAKISYFEQQSFDAATAAGLAAAEPGLAFSPGAASITVDTTHVFVSTASGPTWLGVQYSPSGKFFGLTATAGGSVGRCTTNDVATAKSWTPASCTASTWS